MLDTVSAVLEAFLTHPFTVFIVFIGSVFSITVSIASCHVGRIHKNFALSQMFDPPKKRRLTAPPMTIVMPCKGVHINSVTYWEQQISTLYAGPLEFVWTVESQEDAAYRAISDFIDAHKNKMPPNRSLKLVVAGLSFHNGQKIHNIQTALSLSSRESEYVTFLDDDMYLNEYTLQDMAQHLSEHPELFLATGYCYDLVDEGASFANYMVMAYRAELQGAYGREESHFIWGGCLMLRRKDIDDNKYGIMDAWTDFGYSDDFIMVGILKLMRNPVYVPFGAKFPNLLKGHRSFGAYVNYAARQMFVMRSYTSRFSFFHNFLLVFASFLTNFIIGYPMLFMAMFMALLGIQMSGGTSLPELYQLHFQLFVVYAFYILSNIFEFLSNKYLGLSYMFMMKTESEHAPVNFRINWWKVHLGIWLHHIVFPWICVYSYFAAFMPWSGIRYYLHRGRIAKMERQDKDGNWYTEPREESLRHAVRDLVEAGFLTDKSWAYQPSALGSDTSSFSSSSSSSSNHNHRRSRSRSRTGGRSSP